ESELARLKRETVAEIIEGRDNDRVVAQKAFQRTFFDGHAYGRNPGGTIPSVESVSRDDVIAFYKRYVTQANIVVGMAGDVTPEKAPEIA
ncbi:insulinase family protein, partial [Klebsiella pneumoniae]|uniref:insulinase family protein n=1 Tax=Klebsiella pneumoniae TaxID=573 RepID=UPI0030133D76